MSRTSTTLSVPSTGAKVRCSAHKTYALAVQSVEAPDRLKVIFRTNDVVAWRKRGSREGTRTHRAVYAFSLVTGRYLGYFDDYGAFIRNRD